MQADDAAIRLDRYLDAVIQDGPEPANGVAPDASLAETVDHLARLAAAPAPDPTFAARLRWSLLAPSPSNAAGPVVATRFAAVARSSAWAEAPSRPVPAAEGRRTGAWLATAALLVLTLAGAVATSRLGGIGQGETPTRAASMAALRVEPASLPATATATAIATSLTPVAFAGSLDPGPRTTVITTDIDAVIDGDTEGLEGVRAALDAQFGNYPPACRAGFLLISGSAADFEQGIDLATAVRDVAFSEFPGIFDENTGVQPFWNPAEGDQVGEVELESFFFNGCPSPPVSPARRPRRPRRPARSAPSSPAPRSPPCR